MQPVNSDFKAAAVLNERYPVGKLQISWTRNYSGAAWFEIGVSLIGSSDVIKGSNNIITEADKYEYDDETQYLMSMEYDRWFDEPIYSVARGMMDIILDNNSGRFTPGHDEEIGDDIKARRPMRIYNGFNYHGIDNMIQLMVGTISDMPQFDNVNNTMTLHGIDFTDYLWNITIANTQLFINQRTDQILASLFASLGLSSSQYVLDTGLITIPFTFFAVGDNIGDIVAKLCQAEQGMFYIDENGVYHYENRGRWLNPPHTISQLDITDDIVLSESSPYSNPDKIVNSVEITAYPRSIVAANQQLAQLNNIGAIAPGESLSFFISYSDPAYSVVQPTAGGSVSNYLGNAAADGSGANKTSQLQITHWYDFSNASQCVIKNNDSATVYLTQMTVGGRPAIKTPSQGIYVKLTDQDSIDSYEEHAIKIQNDFIQSYEIATSIAQGILDNWKDPGNYVMITVRAQPHLQLGDLVTRKGINYFIIRIQGKFTAADGMTQILTLVQRTISPIS